MELVILCAGEAVREHLLRIDCFHGLEERGLQPVGIGTHKGEPWPPVEEVAIVREAAAELAVGDLAVVDVPVDEALEFAEIFHLQEGPLWNAWWCLRQREGWLPLLMICLVPVLATEIVLGV